MELYFQALIEDRWVRLMTVQLDMVLGLGAMVTPNNEILLVIGDLGMAVENVRVQNAELLAEDPTELAQSIPALLDLAAPQLTGAIPSVPLPGAAELGGFELNILGVRGVLGPGGAYPNMAVYANLGFDPSQVPNLSFAAQTVARVSKVEQPGDGPGAVELELGGRAPGELEYQVRINSGLWSTFFSTKHLRLERPAFAAQGRHTIEVRARQKGQYRTLDATPEVLEVLIDPEPPKLRAQLATGGVKVMAFDVVSERLALEVTLDGKSQPIELDEEGFVQVPGIEQAKNVSVSATDEALNTTTQRLREDGQDMEQANLDGEQAPQSSGCVCARPAGSASFGSLGLLGLMVGLLGFWRRR